MFKFALYVSLPIAMTFAVVMREDVLQAIIKSVSWAGSPALRTANPTVPASLPASLPRLAAACRGRTWCIPLATSLTRRSKRWACAAWAGEAQSPLLAAADRAHCPYLCCSCSRRSVTASTKPAKAWQQQAGNWQRTGSASSGGGIVAAGRGRQHTIPSS